MSQPPDPRHPLIERLAASRPDGRPDPSVRAAHRAALEDAVTSSEARLLLRSRRGLVAAAAAVAVVAAATGIVVSLEDGSLSQVVASGEDDPSTVDEKHAGPAVAAPAETAESAACGGEPLPFEVPVDGRFGERIDGPAPGAPATDVDGQLVQHWVSDTTSLEVRWPADVSQRVLDEIDMTRVGVHDRVEEGVSPSSFMDADLAVEQVVRSDGSIDVAATSWGNPPSDGRYTIAVVGAEAPTGARPGLPVPMWGDGMCAAVQLTVRPIDVRVDVLSDAEALYDSLVADGGPLQPGSTPEALVIARVEADSLEPVTECDVPAGIDQAPVTSEDVEGGGPYPTPEDALAAYIETHVRTDDGPFGPVESHTVPSTGYTAITLPDGRVAFDFPDPPAPERALVAYFIAQRLDDGWSITRREMPSC